MVCSLTQTMPQNNIMQKILLHRHFNEVKLYVDLPSLTIPQCFGVVLAYVVDVSFLNGCNLSYNGCNLSTT